MEVMTLGPVASGSSSGTQRYDGELLPWSSSDDEDEQRVSAAAPGGSPEPPRRPASSSQRLFRWRLELPVSLLILYGVNALADSYPLTATSQWLNTVVEMPQATQSMFYAASFVPYSLKPVYGWLSEAVSQYTSRPRCLVYCVATVVEALMYVLCGLGVRSVSGAFGAVILRTACSACSEMMLSASLAELVAAGAARPARAQAEATGARWFGTIAGYCLSLWLYRCGNAASTPPSRTVLASTAVILGGAVLVALALPRAFCVARNNNTNNTGENSKKERSSTEGVSTTSSASARRAAALCLVIAQVACAWVALKDLLVISHRDLWRSVFYALLGAAACLCVLACLDARWTPLVSRHKTSSSSSGGLALLVAPAVLVLALNAAPTASIQISNLEFYLFFAQKPCYLPYSELIAAGASVLACWAYASAAPSRDDDDGGTPRDTGGGSTPPSSSLVAPDQSAAAPPTRQSNKDRRRRGVAAKLVLALLCALSVAVSFGYGPLANVEPLGTPDRACLTMLGARLFCAGRFTYDAVVHALDNFFSELALLAQTALVLDAAVKASDDSTRAIAYGALLAVADAGTSVSGWITAPIVDRAGITYGNFHRLVWLIKVCALAKILALAPLPFVRLDQQPLAKNKTERNDAGGSPPRPPGRGHDEAADGGFEYNPLRDRDDDDYDDDAASDHHHL